jgi:hypothetical protein
MRGRYRGREEEEVEEEKLILIEPNVFRPGSASGLTMANIAVASLAVPGRGSRSRPAPAP